MVKAFNALVLRRLAPVFNKWKVRVFNDEMLLYTRKYLGAQLMSIIFRRCYSLRLTRGWIKWREVLSLKERESSKVMTRQISMFRRKIDRVKKRNATLTLYKFMT